MLMLVYRGTEKVARDYTATKGTGLKTGLACQLWGLLIHAISLLERPFGELQNV